MTIKRRRWTAAEDDLVLECDVEKRAKLARKLGRTPNAIGIRFSKLQADRLRALGLKPRPHCRSWTKPERRRLDAMREAGDSWAKCAKALGRTAKSVRVDWHVRHRDPGRKFRWWTPAEDDLLVSMWGKPVKEIGEALGRDALAVNNRARVLRRAGRIGPWLAARLRWIPAIRPVASGVLSEATCSSRSDASQVAVSLHETSV
jgi:hypothetical protein